MGKTPNKPTIWPKRKTRVFKQAESTWNQRGIKAESSGINAESKRNQSGIKRAEKL